MTCVWSMDAVGFDFTGECGSVHPQSEAPAVSVCTPCFKSCFMLLLDRQTHRCHLRHDERFQRCVIMQNYSHMQISWILAVIASDCKHRYSIYNYRQTGCVEPYMSVHAYIPYVVCKCLYEHVLHVWMCLHARGGISHFWDAVNPTLLPFLLHAEECRFPFDWGTVQLIIVLGK